MIIWALLKYQNNLSGDAFAAAPKSIQEQIWIRLSNKRFANKQFSQLNDNKC